VVNGTLAGIAALFPGQGSQFVGMGRSLYDASATAREVFRRADEVVGFALSKLAFEGPESELVQTHNAQPAILTHSLAALAWLSEEGFQPAAAAGHSLGEYSAYVAAGSLELEDAVRLVRRRGELMFQSGVARPGTMAAILGLGEEAVKDACLKASSAGVVVPANLNSPGQIVISGEVGAVESAMELATAAGAKKVVRLPVSGAFHSPLMESAAAGLRSTLAEIKIEDAAIPVVANVSGEPVVRAADIRRSLEFQLLSAVRWEDSMRWLIGRGLTSLVEIGPGRVLKGLARSIDKSAVVESADDAVMIRTFIDTRLGKGVT
jgi:[acyl-carrier-protein] S-malonyltransferase